jgi:uncharacterized sulfatase
MKHITGRNLTKTLGLIGAAAVVIPVATANNPTPHPKPNVIVIQTDEHNFRTLGCYRETLPPEQAFMWGKTVVETPHLDRIAKMGAIAERFYATSPVCSPSRASLITGLYPQNAGVPVNDMPMSDSVVTFAQVLKDHGYATGYIGKWHLEDGSIPGWAPKRKFGFDDNRYMWNRGHWKNLKDTPAGPAVGVMTKDGRPQTKLGNANEKSFTTDFITTKTIDFINKNKNRPFCIMLSIPDPHGPDTVRPPYDTMYKHVQWELPRTYNIPRDADPYWTHPQDNASTKHDQYYGMIKCIDDNMGRLLAALEKNGILENTIIVFTSDHGDMRGEHRKENKGNPFEASARIPFLMTYPGKIKPGLRLRDTMGCIDFKPTLLSLMGIKDTSHNEGRDMSKVFLGQKHDGKDIIFVRCANWGQWTAAFAGQYKLIIDNKSIWLTDLDKDPDEIKNHAYDPAYAPIVKDLAAELLTYMKTHNDYHYEDTPFGVTLLEAAAAGKLKQLTPAEFETAQTQYPAKRRVRREADGG